MCVDRGLWVVIFVGFFGCVFVIVLGYVIGCNLFCLFGVEFVVLV